MPYKPKSLDDLNSWYDSEITATRAIEQGRSKVKDNSPSAEVKLPDEAAIQDGGSVASDVPDISNMVESFIKSMNSPTSSQRPSRINIDAPRDGTPAKKPTYRPGVQAPKTGVQGLSSQQASRGTVVQNRSARPVSDERPMRPYGSQPQNEAGGPNYARQKVAAEEERRQAAQAAKQRKQDEYRKMITGEGSTRRSADDMDEFINEYASVMNDDDEKRRFRREKRKAQRAPEAAHAPEPQPDIESEPVDAFENFFNDVTEDIPDNERYRGYVLSQTQSDFDGMFDGTDMATLPYSAKQFIYEQKLMYEQQARLAREEYDRKREDDFARSQAEQDLLRAEQARIKEEAEERRRIDEEAFYAREQELLRQEEIFRRQKEEEARLQAEEIEILRAEREKLLEEHQRLSEQTEMQRLREIDEQRRIDELSEQNRLISLEAQRRAEELLEQQRYYEEQQRLFEESRQRYEIEAEQDSGSAEELRFDDTDGFAEEADAFDEPAGEYAADEEYPAETADITEEAPVDKRALKKLKKAQAKAEKKAVEQAWNDERELIKAEKKAEKLAKRGKAPVVVPVAEPVDEEPSDENEINFEELQSGFDDTEAFENTENDTFTEPEQTEETPLDYSDEAIEEIDLDEPDGAEVYAGSLERAGQKVRRGAARVFFRTLLSLVLVASLCGLAAVASLNTVFKLNYGEPSLIGGYYFFTTDSPVAYTDIRAGDLVVVRPADSAESGEVVAFVDPEKGTFGFGTKKDVSMNSNGEPYYTFTQGDGTVRSNVVGVVQRSFHSVGAYLALVISYYLIALISFGVLSLLLFFIVVFALRNRAKRKMRIAAAAARQIEQTLREEENASAGDELAEEDDKQESVDAETEVFDEADDAPQSEAIGVLEIPELYSDYEEPLPDSDIRYDDEPAEITGELTAEAEEPVEEIADDTPVEETEEPAETPFDEPEAEEIPDIPVDEPEIDEIDRIGGLPDLEPIKEKSFMDEMNELLGFPEDEDSGLVTLDEIEGMDKAADATEAGGTREFIDVKSSDADEGFLDETPGDTKYSADDDTFFGDREGIFSDFADFDDGEDDRRGRKHKKQKKDRKQQKHREDSSDGDDVFGSF